MKRILKEIGLILLIILLFLGGQLLVSIPIGAILANNPDKNINVLDLALTIPNIALFIGFIIYDKVSKKESILSKKPTKKDSLYSLALGATYAGFGVVFTQTIQKLLGDWYKLSLSSKMVEDLQKILDGANIPLMIIAVGIIAPVVEELFFRGLLFNKSRNYVSVKASAIISALVFGFVHLNIIQGANAFVLGLLFAYIYQKTESIYTTILAHLGNNLMAVLIGYLLNLSSMTIFGYIICAILIVLFIYTIKKFNYEYSNPIKTKKEEI
jgi:transmembrane CAAX amino protease